MTNEIAPYSTTGLVPHNMDEALRLAEFMARARTVPKHLQDSPGDCLMAIEQAMRWGMSPFAVAQATSVISGKLMFEGKLVAAAVESSGAIVGQIDYTFAGEGEGRSITVSATRRGETNPRTVTVTLKEARTGNEMWKRQPDQQLVYHGVRVWARRWTPAVILGVYSREEMGPIIEGEVVSERDAINDAVPLTPKQQRMRGVDATGKPWRSAEGEDADRAEAAERERAAAATTPRAPRVADPKVYAAADPLDEPDGRRWLVNLETALANAQSQDEVVQIGGHHTVGTATANAPPAVKSRISELLATAYARFAEPDLSDEALGDEALEIKGMEKVGAG